MAHLVLLGLLAAALGDAAVTCDLIVRYPAVLELDGARRCSPSSRWE
jgi:hypothetical protein